MKPIKKAWMTAMTKGSKALQARLSSIHADNPEFQAFVKKHGLGGNLSVKQSDKYKKHVSVASASQETKPEAALSSKEREALIKRAADKIHYRRLASANRSAFGGELGGGYVIPRSGFRRYSEAYGDKIPTPMFSKHYIAYHPETKIIKKIGSNRHITKFLKKFPEYKIGYTSWNDKKIGDVFTPQKLGESKKKIVLGKRIPQLPGSTVDHPVPKGYVRVKDSQGFNVLKKIKESTTMSKKNDLPFDPDPPKKNPGVTVGKNPAGYSRARWLARMAMNKQSNNPKLAIKPSDSLDQVMKHNVMAMNKQSQKITKPKNVINIPEAKKSLQELKKSTLASYIAKAAPRIRSGTSLSKSFYADAGPHLAKANKNHPLVFYPDDPEGKNKDPEQLAFHDKAYKTNMDLSNTFARDAKNRIRGITRAAKRLAKEDVVQEGKNPYGSGFKLVHSETGKVYKVGDKIKDDKETHTVLGWQHGSQRGNPSSSGRVRVRVDGQKGWEQEFFPQVFGMKVVKEEANITNESSTHRLDATYKSAFVHGHNRKEDGRSAKVYRSDRTGNWITKHYEDDTKVNHYETDGYEDAHNSAKKWVGSIRSIKYKGKKDRLDESNIMNASKKLFHSKINK